MRDARRLIFELALSIAILAVCGGSAHAQASYPPPNDLPNPYRTVTHWAQLPDGRKWGSTSGVAIGPDGNIWTYERCGGNSCVDSNLAPILEFTPSGKLLKNFGAGMFILPHGIFVDRDGNVWVTDGVGGMATNDDVGKHGKGHQIFKFSPDGKVLLTLGKAGVPGNTPDTFNRPSAVASGAKRGYFRGGRAWLSAEFTGQRAHHEIHEAEGNSSRSGANLGRHRANLTRLTRWPSIPKGVFLSATVPIIASRSSIRTAHLSPSGNSSDGPAGFSSTRTTRCMWRTPNPPTTLATATIQDASAAFASEARETAR